MVAAHVDTGGSLLPACEGIGDQAIYFYCVHSQEVLVSVAGI